MAKSKYEIMILLSPNEDISVAKKLVNEVFGEKSVTLFEKMEDNKLKYEINNSKIATRVLVQLETDRENISEFTRKANIFKTIWRTLVINLDTEKGLHKKAKPFVEKRKAKNFENKFAKSNNFSFKPKDKIVTKKTEETNKD
ncbi:30S ribosomal protein S6 [[Mycoplasma] collis]|uniref:30S ribosomal protein S6 n=1 Tax=[Mycoplasma] collis TaxID=2127 RepID=UPI00051C414C|nr:30S ribosomal protein S6 [[Mycoplasma] collis]